MNAARVCVTCTAIGGRRLVLPLQIAILLYLLLFSAELCFAAEVAVTKAEGGVRFRPTIIVEGGWRSGWGSASADEVQDVLESTADQLLLNFPGRRLHPIIVSRSDSHPVTLYKRGPNGEYLMKLTARNREWANYAYEFGHELTHILHNHEHHKYSATLKYHQWFEEAICEAASLYVLERLAVEWKIAPPRPEWSAYAPKFRTAAQRFFTEKHRVLPPNTSLTAWFEQSEKNVRDNPYVRGHNEVVANILLPLFLEDPQIWDAIGYLNPGSKGATFREYLEGWRDNAPEDYRPIISYVIGLFFIDARQRQ